MKIKDIYQHLDALSPFELQEKWDNSGLIVGSMDQEFDSVVIALDLDLDLVENAQPNSLIITHHPLIFSPLKTVNFDSYATKILQQLIKKDIALISMHTNIDKTHLNQYVTKEVLGFKEAVCEEFLCTAEVNMSFEDLQQYIKDKLGLQTLKTTNANEHIKSVSICTGSGMSLIPYVKADCFLTGDIKYHDAMEAQSRNINLIDIGHYESEQHFAPMIKGLLEEYLKLNQIKAIITTSKNPFDYN